MDDQKRNRQIELEQEMANLGAEAFEKDIRKAREKHREDGTFYGKHMMVGAVARVAEGITSFLELCETGRAGRRHRAYRYLTRIDAETAAFFALRAILEGVTRDQHIQSVALHLADWIEDEMRFRFYENAAPGLYNFMKDKLRSATSDRHKKKVLVRSMNQTQVEWEAWPKQDKLHLGIKLIDIVIEKTGYVQRYNQRQGENNTIVTLQVTDRTMEWIGQRCAQQALLCPMWLPMIVPPRDWTGPINGGYLTSRLPRLKMVKTRNAGYMEELNNRVQEMQVVYQSVNALQRTAWKINQPVLDVIRQCWDRGYQIGKLPNRDNSPLPVKPHNIDSDEEARRDWRRAASKVYEKNNRSRSRRLQVAKCIWIAEKFYDEAEIYFPYQLDFRGRIYAVPTHLNPQGADYAKALLTFAKGEAISDGVAAGWLAIHGANCFGFDKVTLEDRISWVEARNELLCKIAADPLGTMDLPLEEGASWVDAEKPFQFLAFCNEWAGFLRDGYGFISHLPIAMDGSNNGLQNFAAMLRDPTSGEAVNLVPGETPSDIYQRVADVVEEKICLDLSTGGTENQYASGWLALGVNRKLTKRPVMVLPYGGTLFSCREYVEDYLDDLVEKGQELPWPEEALFAATNYMAKHIWASIGEVVVAARQAMDWLQKAARLAGAEGMPVVWTAPTGFPVMQAYPDLRPRRVKTQMGASLVYLTLNEETDAIDRRRQANGISPNFVHSMDAAHLCLSVMLALDNGVENFAMIHDSYGTHAAKAEMLSACLRHAFVDMYSEHDVLADFRADMLGLICATKHHKLPALPRKGSLDLEQVKGSAFFFA